MQIKLICLLALIGPVAIYAEDVPLLGQGAPEPIICMKDYVEYKKQDFCLANLEPVTDSGQ